MDFSTAKQESPPWQSGLIGMKVCSIMADCHGGQGQLHDGGSCQDGIWQQTADPADILQYTVTDADAAVQSSLAPGASRAEPYAWMLGLRAKQAPGSDLIWAAPGEDWLYSGEKEGIQAKNGSVGGRVMGKKAPFFVQQG